MRPRIPFGWVRGMIQLCLPETEAVSIRARPAREPAQRAEPASRDLAATVCASQSRRGPGCRRMRSSLPLIERPDLRAPRRRGRGRGLVRRPRSRALVGRRRAGRLELRLVVERAGRDGRGAWQRSCAGPSRWSSRSAWSGSASCFDSGRRARGLAARERRGGSFHDDGTCRACRDALGRGDAVRRRACPRRGTPSLIGSSRRGARTGRRRGPRDRGSRRASAHRRTSRGFVSRSGRARRSPRRPATEGRSGSTIADVRTRLPGRSGADAVRARRDRSTDPRRRGVGRVH